MPAPAPPVLAAGQVQAQVNADGSNPVNLTNNPAYDGQPAWSPDGTRIAFTSDRDGRLGIYVMNADGSNPAHLTNNPASRDSDPAWSPDGKRIAFVSYRDGNRASTSCLHRSRPCLPQGKCRHR